METGNNLYVVGHARAFLVGCSIPARSGIPEKTLDRKVYRERFRVRIYPELTSDPGGGGVWLMSRLDTWMSGLGHMPNYEFLLLLPFAAT